MRITSTGDAVAGKAFVVDVVLENRVGKVRFYIGSTFLSEQRIECPDPPCHESVKVDLPNSARGQVLTIETDDLSGVRRITRDVR